MDSSLDDSLDLVKEKSFTIAQSIRTKSMYGGALETISRKELYYINNKFVIKEFRFSPTFYNCLAEPINNSFDQAIRVKDAPKNQGGKVTEINIDFNKGHLVCFNNGVGMPVKQRKHIDGKKYWNMYLNCTQTMTGSNQKEDNTDKIVGGDNGLGLKLLTYSSNKFICRSGDVVRNKFYEQVYECEIKNIKDSLKINEPIIVNLDKIKETRFKSGGTEFDVRLDLKHLGYNKFSNEDNKHAIAYIKALVSLLSIHSTLYGLSIKCRVNGQLMNILPISMVKRFGFEDYIHHKQTINYKITMKDNTSKKLSLPFDLFIALNPLNTSNGFNISLINNVVSIDEGKSTHLSYIKKYIRDKLKISMTEFCKKRKLGNFDMRKIFNNVTLFVSAKIPGISYDSQKKTNIEFDERKIYSFELPNEFLENLQTKIEKVLLIKHQRLSIRELKAFATAKSSDYKPAPILNSINTHYIIAEGEHALETMIKLKDYLDYPCTTFHSKGVPVNSLKETFYETNIKGEKILQLTEKFKKVNKQGLNENRLLQMMNHIGLKFEHKYEENAKGDKEFSLLKAKCLVIATDQDKDGIGNICTLIILFIYRFWPCLLDRGFVKRYESPLIRLKKNNVSPSNEIQKIILSKINKLEFYSENSFEIFVKNLVDFNIDDIKDNLTKLYKIEYYKGLGSHSDEDIVNMAENFDKHLLTIVRDKNTNKFVEVICGKNPDLRKNELKKIREKEDPLIKVKTLRLGVCRTVSFSHHIKHEARFYHLLKITRALPNFISGLTISSTKIVFQMLKSFRTNNTPKPVAKVAGNIKDKMQYHHGETSLEGTIILMAQNYKGANNIPLLKGSGQFGSIIKGPNSNIQPRYVKVSLNLKLVNLIFPPESLKIVDYNYEDGIKVEPKYLCPIIPLSILENRSVPGSGWKISTWGRNVKDVIKLVKKKINNEDISKYELWGKLNIPNGRMSTSKGISKEEDVATFYIKKDIIYIKDLPLGVYLDSFVENIDSSDFAKCIFVNKTEKQNGLLIKVKISNSQWLDKIKENDRTCLKKLRLISDLDSHLNYTDHKGNVHCFDTYNEVLEKWFPYARDMIKGILKRMVEVKEVKLIELENILRYLKEEPKYNITNKSTKDEINEILEKNNFVKLDLNITDVKDVKKFALKYGSLNYKYIHNIKFIKKSEEGYKKYKDLLESTKDDLEKIKKYTWETYWLELIDKLLLQI